MSGLLRSTATVCFREVPERELDAGAKAECAEHWARAQSVNPSLFDGAVLLASDLRWSGSSCEVDFFEGSYSRYHWVRCTGRRYGPGALFASVLATTLEGALLAGCMAETTSTPGRIQLPGGNIERVRREPLDIRTAMASAARELAEEVGIQVDTGELELTHVKSGGDHGDVGLIFSVRLPRAIPHLASVFAQHLQSLARAGATAEFSELVAVSGNWWPPGSTAPFAVDYMADAIRVALRLTGRPLRYSTERSDVPGVRQIGVAVVA